MQDMDKDRLIKSAIVSILTLSSTNLWSTTKMDPPAHSEKCYGIARQGMNDCQTATSSCASSSVQDRQSDAFIFLPQGTCNKIVGGTLTQASANEKQNVSAKTSSSASYILDPDHTYVLWHADHFGFSRPSGKWMANGTLNYNVKSPEKSQVNVTINMADLTTGIPDLDKHLKGTLFFNVQKFPTATFVSNKVELKDKQVTKVHGTLTIRDISKPIVLDITREKNAQNPITEKPTLGFSATTSLNRSDFGIKTLLPGVGDKIEIEIELEASEK